MNLQPHLDRLQKRFAELETRIASPALFNDHAQAQAVLKEHAQVKATLALQAQIARLEQAIADNQALISADDDPELTALAREELPALEQQLPALRQTLLTNLLPPDPNDSRDTIIEIRAGTGGDEAGIFSADLFRMYTRHAETAGWHIDVMNSSPSTMGGYKEIIFTVSGDDVFKKMRFESGVHRVQRVPATESQGRIHTSTATVAVLPEAREVDLVIRPDEIRVEVCRAGGPGGQGVNTTDSAVQILHLPTGLIVRCQDGRSQLKNRDKAMNILRARLLEQKQNEENAQYAANRKQQIGSGDRNEKIRTYNYPQNRITDHRINYTMYNLEAFMEGDIEELLRALQAADVELRLAGLDK
ncbi:MAG: peptide chain release factor 1 [Verrucomicrobiales bacterium]|jgi:peptide chain release factor 1|nr:peptide chain release factor 1 [Verrucomicrobiales bacterium]